METNEAASFSHQYDEDELRKITNQVAAVTSRRPSSAWNFQLLGC